MPIIVGIDGTGVDDNPKYAKTFENSFVRRICKSGPDTMYFRGPIALGGGLMESVFAGRDFIVRSFNQAVKSIPKSAPGYHKKTTPSVLLTGYSRGGAGVIVIAKLLKSHSIPVQAMLLFDAVDRHAMVEAGDIPDNVSHVLHVRRHPGTNSRVSFGNCGLSWKSPTNYKQEFFSCTHGGMGGTPWKGKDDNPNDLINEAPPSQLMAAARNKLGISSSHYADSDLRTDGLTNVTYGMDEEISKKVWNYVLPFMIKHKFM